MEPIYTGGCACGVVRFEMVQDPIDMSNCHCRDCQRATGGPYFPSVICKVSDFNLLQGTPSWFEKMSDGRERVGRSFCPDCGSPLMFVNAVKDDIYAIYASAFDDPSFFKPSIDIYTASAQPWDHISPDAKCYARSSRE
ncbi:MAG: GFA family protein [Sneathiella sp.]|nr:GFA family protein [Sneathiella sp.]